MPLGNYVPPEGPLSARYVFIGDYPSGKEEHDGLPIAGGARQLLDQMLANARIPRSECYFTNLVKLRPPGGTMDSLYADSKQLQPTSVLQAAISELDGELRRLSPMVIIPLGDEALRHLTGKRSITKWRGSILSTPYGKCVGTHHPRDVLKQYGLKPIVERDLSRVLDEGKSTTISLPEHRFTVGPTLDEVLAYIRRCRSSPRIAFDIETTGTHTRCLGISCSSDSAICIPFTKSPNQGPVPTTTIPIFSDPTCHCSRYVDNYWSLEEEHEILHHINDLFLDPNIQKVAQNYQFDATILATEFGLWCRNVFMDTMVAHHTCYPELPKGLDFLCSVYTRTPYYSDYDASCDRETWIYNCYDAAITLEVSYALEKELSDLGMAEFYRNHVHPTVLALCRVQSRGIRVHRELRDARRAETETQLADVDQRLKRLVGAEFNPLSPKQVSHHIYVTLGLPVQKDPKTHKPTTNEKALQVLATGEKYAKHRPFFDLLFEYRGLAKLISTYYDVPLDSQDRIYTNYNAAGTVTGRLSSSEPLLLPGTNLQNPPKGQFRQIFIPRDGHVLIKADLSQAEFRLAIWMARVRKFIEEYTKHPHFDAYKEVASRIYNKPPDQITDKERALGKVAGLASNYAMRPKKAALTYNIPLKDAEFIQAGYYATLPEIQRNFWAETQRMLHSTRRTTNPLGRTRIYFGRVDDDLYREAYSNRAQSTVGDIINRALHVLEELLPEGARILLQVHDELVVECRTDIIESVMSLMRRVMEYPLKFPGVPEPLTIPAEITVGPNWFDQYKLEVWKEMQNGQV